MQRTFDMENAPLISVIIPVYKAEDTLNRCVDSVLNGTYPNLEILLMDDGSPDRSGEIADRYAEKDSRVRVIHEKNGGQSVARNRGIRESHGAYLGFVDSDDAIKPEMFEHLYEALRSKDADIAVCGMEKIFSDKTEVVNAFSEETVFSQKEAMEEILLDDKISSHPCNKLFKRELFDEIRFPEGRVYEDLSIMPSVFHKCRRIVCIPSCDYLYYIHPGSTSFSFSPKRTYGLYRAFRDRYESALNWDIRASVMEKALERASYFAITALIEWNPKEEETIPYIEDARGFLKKYRKEIQKNSLISIKNKLRIKMAINTYGLLKRIYR